MRLFEFVSTKTLYVSRELLNTDDITLWAASQGLKTMLFPNDLHVTVCYSKQPVTWDIEKQNDVLVLPGLDELQEDEQKTFVREMEMFGKDKNILVLRFSSEELLERNQEFRDHGCSYDFPEYKSHLTISYNGADIDISDIKPYTGRLEFGPEIYKEINTNWDGTKREFDLTDAENVPRQSLIDDDPK